MFYAVQGTIVHHTKDRYCCSVTITKQIPTFYLNADVQGILNKDHAEKIAREIIYPIDSDYEDVEVRVNVSQVISLKPEVGLADMKTLELNDQQGEMLRVALSYMAANLDDVNEALDKEFSENAVAELMLKVVGADQESSRA
jgi:hypothetical protein